MNNNNYLKFAWHDSKVPGWLRRCRKAKNFKFELPMQLCIHGV